MPLSTQSIQSTQSTAAAKAGWHDLTPLLPQTPGSRENGRTHGLAVDRCGRLVVFRQAGPAVVILDPGGAVAAAWGDDFAGAHGLTLVEEGGEEFLWLTDEHSGRVAKFTPSGDLVREIAPPPPGRRPEGKYSPTWVAVDPVGGDIWVADGYGSNVVHRHSAAGEWRQTLTGEEGPGRFARPHGIAFSPAGELWVADRRNKRIVIYDRDGACLRHADGVCHSPCGFAFAGGLVYVPELFGSVKVLRPDLTLVRELGANEDVRPAGGWPGQDGWGWPTLAGWPDLRGTPADRAGRFLAPHGVAVDGGGSVYVAEWVRGGRLTKLTFG